MRRKGRKRARERENKKKKNTFSKSAFIGRLSTGENGFDENAQIALCRVPAADDAKAETLFLGTFLEGDVEDRVVGGPDVSW